MLKASIEASIGLDTRKRTLDNLENEQNLDKISTDNIQTIIYLLMQLTSNLW